MASRRIDQAEGKKPGPKRARVRYTRGMSKTELFIANVNAIIEAGDISVSEIARRADIQRPHLSRVLSGQGGCRLEWAEKIANAVGVPLEELLAGPVAVAK